MLSQKDFLSYTAAEIADLARSAAILEVSVSPKPGLVCPDTPGAHSDMDYHTFISSALSLHTYFETCVQIGQTLEHMSADQRFVVLRRAGVAAEKEMYAATGGINTHKGLIFSLGIVCCAAGTQQVRLRKASSFDPRQQSALLLKSICDEAAQMVKGMVQRELVDAVTVIHDRPLTAGEHIYQQYGITGIRGEAEAGFPHVVQAFEHLVKALAQQNWNDACCHVLLFLILHTQDTNVVHRRGLAGLQALQKGAEELFAKVHSDAGQQYRDYCAVSTRSNLSPGGCADLLALTLFFYLMFYGRT